MASEFLKHLLSSGLQFRRLKLRTNRVVVIVVSDDAVAVEANRQSIIDIVGPTLRFLLDMVNMDVRPARLLAKTAVTVRPQQHFCSY